MSVKIRPWRIEDAALLARAINNKKVQDNLRDGLPFPYTVADAKEFISAMLDSNSNNTFAWAITACDVLVGSIGAYRKENVHRLTAEIGYFISEEHWGGGVATEAVKQACGYIFDKTDIVRIFAEPFDFNIASCRVLEKAGFVCEGTLRKNAIKNDLVIDMKMYARVKQ